VIVVAEPQDVGKRLDAFLHERLPEFSRSRLQSWIKEKRVLLRGHELRASYLLRGGETLTVEPAGLRPLRAEPEALPLTILYEDPDVVAIDKPAGMVVHAGAGHDRGTVVNALLHRFGSLSSLNGELRPGIVHRLDRDTSGVLVVARNDRAHQALAAQFQTRVVEKHYLALVHGRMKQPSGRITDPITRDPQRRTRMTSRLGVGRSAVTEFRMLEELGQFSLLAVRIRTGRTHQIRVHLSNLHHPIVGDRLYGAPARVVGLPELPRFLLHAHRLRFQSPASGDWITVESPLPPLFCEILDALRKERG
jgi:23S rRNA pseudouridine1911/1915/1917 synthase